ncbi:MAG: hypothetical protein ACFE8M_10175 [Candidatus Hermodarchaeota archaeon]
MKNGGIIALLGGIISLVGTFVLTFYESATYNIMGSGIGLLVNIGDSLATAAHYGWIVYFYEILFLILIWGGVLQIVGAKIRALAILGGIFAITLAVFLIVVAFGGYSLPSDVLQAAFFFSGPSGAYPLHVAVGDYVVPPLTAGLGIYFLLVGGVLAFIGGAMPRD